MNAYPDGVVAFPSGRAERTKAPRVNARVSTPRKDAQQGSLQRSASWSDVFEGTLEGLRLAEAEFNSAAKADAFVLPDFILQEVTSDVRFTGGQLVCASRLSVEKWLAEYGITLSEPRLPRSPKAGQVIRANPDEREVADSDFGLSRST